MIVRGDPHLTCATRKESGDAATPHVAPSVLPPDRDWVRPACGHQLNRLRCHPEPPLARAGSRMRAAVGEARSQPVTATLRRPRIAVADLPAKRQRCGPAWAKRSSTPSLSRITGKLRTSGRSRAAERRASRSASSRGAASHRRAVSRRASPRSFIHRGHCTVRRGYQLDKRSVGLLQASESLGRCRRAPHVRSPVTAEPAVTGWRGRPRPPPPFGAAIAHTLGNISNLIRAGEPDSRVSRLSPVRSGCRRRSRRGRPG